MILEFFISTIFFIINGFLSLIPSFELPQSAINAITTVFALIQTVGYFIPLGTLFTVILVMLTFYNITILWGAINWVIRKIPGIS